MKTIIKSFFVLIIFIKSASSSDAQAAVKQVQTVEFTVTGVCGMCESRIEKAALIKGVKLAEWSKDTQAIRVIYKTSKVSLADIKASILAAGHDVGELTSDDEAYNSLPGCCKYKDGVEVH